MDLYSRETGRNVFARFLFPCMRSMISREAVDIGEIVPKSLLILRTSQTRTDFANPVGKIVVIQKKMMGTRVISSSVATWQT